MDETKRAAEIALAASHGDKYGTAEVSPSGVDRSQLRRNLRLTPRERLEQMVHAVGILQPLRGVLRRSSR